MKLLSFQQAAISRIDEFLLKVSTTRAALAAIGQGTGIDVPSLAWGNLGGVGRRPYSSLLDASNESIPCLSVVIPTGGGKTITALAAAIAALRRCGSGGRENLLVWVVPSEAIYEQTCRYLDRGYLEEFARDSGFASLNLKLIGSAWTDLDFAPDVLTVLLVTQQSIFGARRDLYFVRPSDALQALGLWSDSAREPSLVNLLELLKPVFVIDEAHRVYTESGRTFFRTRAAASCVLEFSATPRDYSNSEYPNVIESVPASALIAEGLIKNPLVCALEPALSVSELLAKVVAERIRLSSQLLECGYLVSPKVLVSCRRTGTRHASDPLSAQTVRSTLLDLGVSPDAIAIKSSEQDQLKGHEVDSPNCGLQFILTQRALVEGWDAKSVFFIVLVNEIGAPLTNFQIVGRGLRQPDRNYFGNRELNRLRVYTNGLKQEDALAQLRAFLADEGLTSGLAITLGGSVPVEVAQARLAPSRFRLPSCHLPPVADYVDYLTAKHVSGSFPGFVSVVDVIAAARTAGRAVIQIDLADPGRAPAASGYVAPGGALDASWKRRFSLSLLKQVAGCFVHASDASRWLEQQCDHLFADSSADQLAVLGPVRAAQIVSTQTFSNFSKIRQGITLSLIERASLGCCVIDTSGMPSFIATPDPLGTVPFRQNLLGDVPKSLLNAAELDFARHIEGLGLSWFRNGVGEGWYSLPGGMTGRFFPDFVVPIGRQEEGVYQRVLLFETKGAHLIGSDDSIAKLEACRAITGRFRGHVEAYFGTFSDLKVVLERVVLPTGTSKAH